MVELIAIIRRILKTLFTNTSLGVTEEMLALIRKLCNSRIEGAQKPAFSVQSSTI